MLFRGVARVKKRIIDNQRRARYIKKSSSHFLLGLSKSERFNLMHKYASELNIERMAKLLGVSTSGYYEYIKLGLDNLR